MAPITTLDTWNQERTSDQLKAFVEQRMLDFDDEELE